EYVEGIDLERMVKQSGPLPVDRACDFIRQTARGLQHAYERGLRHGNLRAANLLIVQLPARREAADPAYGEDSHPSLQSVCGSLVKIRNLGLTLPKDVPHNGPGNPMSQPDFQVPSTEPDDIRADVYRLGCIFYFLLTGQVPSPAGSAADDTQQHQG